MSRGKFVSAAAGVALTVAVAVAGTFEGETLHAIIPVKGDVPTICKGHTEGVYLGMTATPAQCKEWFEVDLSKAFDVLARKVKVPMPETRRGALASFVFNVGAGAFSRSTLLKKLNAGDWRGACHELIWYRPDGRVAGWVHASGRVLNGLVKRRTVERDICLLQPEEEKTWWSWLLS